MARYRYQILVIAASLVLLGILYLLPNKSKYVAEIAPVEVKSAGAVSYLDLISQEKESLVQKSIELSEEVLDLDSQIASTNNKSTNVRLADSLATLCLATSPLLSAHYLYQKAQFSKSSSDWTRSGDFYMLLAESLPNDKQQIIISKAIESFEQAMQLDSTNPDTKVRLASAYVEAQIDPMKGIGMLKEVVEAYPTNIAAQFNLGLFSMKSGQYNKAIPRFNSVLELDSTYYHAYFYLGQCELQLGNKQKAIENFKYYQYLCTDSLEKQNIKQYINQLLTT